MYDYRQALIPQPQKITDSGAAVCLDAACVLNAAPAASDVFASAVAQLKEAFAAKGAALAACGQGYPITLSVGNCKVTEKEGYTIEITADGAVLTGADDAGAFYAAVTFEKLLYVQDGKLYLPVTAIEDYPSFPERGQFLEDRYGSEFMTLDDYKEAIDYFAKMKFNSLTIGVYGCWGVQYDNRRSEYLYVPISKHPELKTPMHIKYYSAAKQEYVIKNNVLPTMFEQDFFGQIVAYAKKKNIEVRPLFNSLGHNTLIPNVYPELSAVGEDGQLLGRGMCPSNPKTYEVLFNIYDEIVDKYLTPNGITSFHIGMDEVHVADQCHCAECSKKPFTEMAVDHVIKLTKHLKEKGIQHVHMYYDTIFNYFRTASSTYFAAGEKPMTQDEVDAAVARTAQRFKDEGIYENAILDWWSYGSDEKLFHGRTLNSAFRSVIKPMTGYYHWVSPMERNDSIYGCAKRAVKYGYEGIESYSAWEYCFDRPYQYQAQVSWNTNTIEDQQGFYNSYAYALCPEAPEAVGKAMAILGDLTEDDRKSNKIGKLDYYWTSYKKAALPYPRCYFDDVKNYIENTMAGDLTYFDNTLKQAAEALAIFETAPIADEKIRKTHIASCKHFLVHAENYKRLYAIMAGNVEKDAIEAELKDIIANYESLIKVAEETRMECTMYHYARNLSIQRELCLVALDYLKTNPEEFSLAAAEKAGSERLSLLR